MPLKAIRTDTKEAVYIFDHIQPKYDLRGLFGRDGVLVCPDVECNSKLTVVQGEIVTQHFRHIDSNAGCYFSNESIEHVIAKEALMVKAREMWPEAVVECEMYIKIDGEKRFIDVAVTFEEYGLALEAQISNQGIKEYERRTAEYRRYGYETVWFNGSHNKHAENWCKSNCISYGSLSFKTESSHLFDTVYTKRINKGNAKPHHKSNR